MPKLVKFITPVNDLALRHGDLQVKFLLMDNHEIRIQSITYVQAWAHSKKADITFLITQEAPELYTRLLEMCRDYVLTEEIQPTKIMEG